MKYGQQLIVDDASNIAAVLPVVEANARDSVGTGKECGVLVKYSTLHGGFVLGWRFPAGDEYNQHIFKT